MKILAIETATEACSAALLIDGAVLERYQVEPRQHSKLILPMMDELLAEAGLRLQQLDALAFGRGPGAFTGVRIATGVVQGAAFAADLPVVPISTLAALAHRSFREEGETHLLAAFDARMQEVYWGGYEVQALGQLTSVIADEISNPANVSLPQVDKWHGVGTGWGSYEAPLSERVGERLLSISPKLYCSAQDVAWLAGEDFAAGKSVSADQALPVYLRDKVASRPAGM